MWKTRKEDEKPYVPQPSQSPVVPAFEPRPLEPPKIEEPRVESRVARPSEMARIGKLVSVKGELSGQEDLYVDGDVEGNIDLSGHSLSIGPNGRIRANIQAHSIVIFGKVDGNVRGHERVELKKSAVVNGDISTHRIVIEEGAFLKGGIDIQKAEVKPEVRRESVPAAPVVVATGVSVAMASGQGSLLENKQVDRT